MARNHRRRVNPSKHFENERRRRTFYILQFEIRVREEAEATSVRGAARHNGVTSKHIRNWRQQIGNYRRLPANQRARRFTLHSGPQVAFENVERLLKDWHTERVTVDNQIVTIRQLMDKARESEPNLQEMNDSTLRSKIKRFMVRHELVLRRVTTHSAMSNGDLQNTVDEFVEDFRNTLKKATLGCKMFLTWTKRQYFMICRQIIQLFRGGLCKIEFYLKIMKRNVFQ